jgi:hypothetical protein
MSFPSNPTSGQTTQLAGITYTYSGSTNSWTRVTSGITVPTANITALSLGGGTGQLTSSEVYNFDDLSVLTDGFKNLFPLRYNGIVVSTIKNPWQLQVTVNGAQQPAFRENSDVVWQGQVLTANKGYTLDTNGNLKFADSIPVNSQVTVRTQMGTNTTTRLYPFNPLDIMTGA